MDFLRFIGDRWLPSLLVSILVLTPCVWHHHIEAGDLGSHVYNAWLVQLIHQKQAPGLWIASQWNNVLFDFMLSGLGSVFGLAAAEKIAVACCVLIFFWGAFVLICTLSRGFPWFLLPAVAMISYGWVFNAGFFNYYLAIGLSFWSFAAFLAWRGYKRLYGFLLAPLILLASPLGLVWLVAAAAYAWIAERLPLRFQPLILVPAAIILAQIHFYLWHHYRVRGPNRRPIMINGIDQLVVYADRYRYLAAAAFLFGVSLFALELLKRGRDSGFWNSRALSIQLYLLIGMGVVSLPSVIYLPQYASPLWYLLERLSLISAVLACAVLGATRMKLWAGIGFSALAIVYFSFLYADTGGLSRMEDQVASMVSSLPPGQRVMQTILTAPGKPQAIVDHLVDRACIARCFAYGNYEPTSLHFRVRAQEGNPIVNSSTADTSAMELGVYVVRQQDLPAYQIYQCSVEFTQLCIRELRAGETNDRLGIHPGRNVSAHVP